MVDTLHCHLQIHPPSGSIILVMLHFMQKATPQQLLSGIIIIFLHVFHQWALSLTKKHSPSLAPPLATLFSKTCSRII